MENVTKTCHIVCEWPHISNAPGYRLSGTLLCSVSVIFPFWIQLTKAYLPKVAADDQTYPFKQVILHAYLPEIRHAPKHARMADWRKRRETGADEAGQAERAPLETPELRTEEGHGGCRTEGQDLQASISASSPRL